MKRRLTDGIPKSKDRSSPLSFWHLCSKPLTNVFSEIIHEIDMLEKCYTPIRSRDFDEDFIVEVTTGIPSALICGQGTLPDKFISESVTPYNNNASKLVLVVNDIGSGKTTYLHHYFKVTIREFKLDNNVFGILIDLRDLGKVDDLTFEEIEMFIHNKIKSFIYVTFPEYSSPEISNAEMLFWKEFIPYKGLIKYNKEKSMANYEEFIAVKLNGFISDIKIYNRAIIRQLVGTKKKFYLVLDNVDHFNKSTQEKIFGLCTLLHSDLNVGVIMSARDYTMPNAFRHMQLSAYEPRFLHLSLPDIKSVIQKRIEYLFSSNVISQIYAYHGKDTIEFWSPSGTKYRFIKEDLQREFTNILNSLLTDEIIKILECLSAYDIRTLLKMIRIALSSGYLLPDDREKKDRVRPRDFLRAVMCGNKPSYFSKDEENIVINLFDNEEPNYELNNLIRIRTLQAIKYYGDRASVDETINFMTSLNYPLVKVKDILQLFLDMDLIESTFQVGNNLGNDYIKNVKLTVAGEYYLFELLYNETYLEEIKNSTYLEEKEIIEVREYMDMGRDQKLSKEERIACRIYATRVFLECLTKLEESEKKKVEELRDFNGIKNYENINGTILKIRDRYIESTKRHIKH